MTTSVAFAADVVKPTISANDYTTKQGNYAYITVSASDFMDVASIEVLVYYDSNYFEINSNSKQSILDGCQVDINTDVPGEARLSAISQNVIEGAGSLWYITFRVKDSAPVGKYPITLAVGEAYGKDLSPKEIGSSNFYINVEEKPKNIPDMYIYSNISGSYKQNDTFEINYYSYNCYNLAAADFEVDYDRTKFGLLSANLGNALTSKKNATYSINDDIPGYIKVSYTSLEGVSSANPILTLKFKVLKNEASTSDIVITASSLYDASLNQIKSSGRSTSITTVYVEPIVIKPQIILSDYEGCANNFSISLTAQQTTKLAAGDFEIQYNTTYMTALEVVSGDESSMVVINPKFDAGLIKCSFVCEDGILKDTTIINIKFKRNTIGSTSVTLKGLNLVDSGFNALDIEYVDSNIKLVDHNLVHIDAKNPTCTEDGYTAYKKCSDCDYHTEFDVVPSLGHDYDTEWTIDKQPTCTEKGSKSHHCKRCGDKKDVTEIPMIDHVGGEVIIENKVEATCTTGGSYDEVTYCTQCGKELSRVHKSILALGHDYDTEWTIDKQPTCTEKGSKSHHCKRCGDKKDITEIPMIDHVGGEVVIENKVEATCTTAGSYDEVIYCVNCGKEISRVQKSIPILEHTFGDWVISKNATCTETGEKYRICSVCKHKETEFILALGHDWDSEWTIDVKPTSKTVGSKSHHCKRCDAKKDITEIPKIALIDVTIDSTIQNYVYGDNDIKFDILSSVKDNFKVEYYYQNKYQTQVPLNAGTYDVKITRPEDDVYYEYNKIIKGGLVISKKEVRVPAKDNTNFIYTGKQLTYNVVESEYYTVTGNKQTNVGSYKVIISLKDSLNYMWDASDNNILEYDFVIKMASISLDENNTKVDINCEYGFVEGDEIVFEELDKNNYSDKVSSLEQETVKIEYVLNINIKNNGEIVKDKGKITVSIELMDNLNDKEFKLFNIYNNGSELVREEISDYSVENGILTFNTDHLETFAFTSEIPTPSNMGIIIVSSIVAVAVIGLAIMITIIVLKKKKNKI